MRGSVSGGDTVSRVVSLGDLHGRGCAAVSVHGRPEAAGELRTDQLRIGDSGAYRFYAFDPFRQLRGVRARLQSSVWPNRE